MILSYSFLFCSIKDIKELKRTSNMFRINDNFTLFPNVSNIPNESQILKKNLLISFDDLTINF